MFLQKEIAELFWEFSFLNGKQLYSYKFIPDLGVFVPIEETYFGTYDANFLELYDLQKAEADVNGIYVTLSQNLPETIVVSAEQVVALRETASVTPPAGEVSTKPSSPGDNGSITEGETVSGNVSVTESEAVSDNEPVAESETVVGKEQVTDEKMPEVSKETEGTSTLVMASSNNTVKWKFTNGQEPDNFTAEATVKVISETEVSVDFAYSGLLPEGTEVTVQIPSDNVNYKEGDTLYLYYCNPETNQRDFVGEGKCEGSKVTFKINHCSEYVITAIGSEDVEKTDGSMLMWISALACGVIVCGVAGLVILKKKK